MSPWPMVTPALRRLVEFGGGDRVAEFAVGLHTAQCHHVEQHTADVMPLPSTLSMPQWKRAEAGHRIGGKPL